MDKIKENLEKFAKKDLAVREALAKRQKRLVARHNALRLVELAIGIEPDQKWHGIPAQKQR